MTERVAQVALPLPLFEPYTYSIPESIADRVVPGARVGHIGLYRDHDTLGPVDYYFKIPGDAAERDP